MSLAAKISAGFLMVVALMVGLSWYQLAVIYRLHTESRQLAQIDLEASNLGLGLQGQMARLRQLGHKFLVLRDAGYAAELRRLRQLAEADLDRLAALELADSERRALERLTAQWTEYAAAAEIQERHVFELRSVGPDGFEPGSLERRPPQVEPLRAELEQHLDAVTDELGRLTQISREAMEARVIAGGERVERARRVAWGATIIGLAVAALISLGIVRSLLRPLRQLTRGTRELAGGRLDYRVPVAGGPELEGLAEDFNAMARHLGELDRLKRDFVANVSHDLKAPLASIQEATELLLAGIPGPLADRQRRLLELNLASGRRLTRMIGDLLDLSRLETGTVEYDLRPEDLRVLTRSAVDTVAALAADKKLEVEEDFPTTPAEIECDAAAIVKVVQNLLSNAVKFTPAGGDVGLRIRTVEDDGPAAVILEVRDSGPGVPDEHKQSIFERFHRIDAGGDGPPGTGLGLAIAREIVAGHGGELWVEDGAGGGSVFKVLLRRQTPASAPGEDGKRYSADRGSAAKASAAALCVLALTVPVLGGCRPPEPPPIVRPTSLEIGDAQFERGDFGAASAAYETWLADNPPTLTADRVVFRLALMCTLPGSPVHSPRRGRQLFAELIERYPKSPFRPAAEYLLGLQREIEELRRQLEEIKRIDLGGR